MMPSFVCSRFISAVGVVLLFLNCGAAIAYEPSTTTSGSFLPRIVEHPSDIIVPRDEPGTLQCKAEGAPRPTIEWFKDGQAVLTNSDDGNAPRYVLPSGALFFIYIKRSDAGDYYCVAKNSLGEVKSKNASLRVAYMQEHFRRAPQAEIRTAAGESAMLECQPPRGFPVPRVYWKKDKKQLHTTGRYTLMDESNLVIQNVQASDAGIYYCVAENMAETLQVNATLRVSLKPKFLTTPRDETVYAGDSVRFECDVAGEPRPIVTWRRKGGVLPSSARMQQQQPPAGDAAHPSSPSLALVIDVVDEAADGEYECVAENDVGTVSSSAMLTVHSRPTFLVTPRDQRVGVAQDAYFECRTSGRPPPTVFWTKDGAQHQLVFQNTRHGRMNVTADGTLIIASVMKSDAGTYICSALSVAGNSQTQASLEVTSVVDQPPPVIMDAPPSNQTVQAGAQLRLPCSADGKPIKSLSLTWLKDGVPIALTPVAESRRATIDAKNNTLIIKDVRKVTDDGIYTCVAQSDAGKTTFDAYVKISSQVEDQNTIQQKSTETAETAVIVSKPLLANVTTNSATLQWSFSSMLPTTKNRNLKFRVEYFAFDEPGSWIYYEPLVSAGSTSATVERLRPATTYIFLIRPFLISNGRWLTPSPVSEKVRTASRYKASAMLANDPVALERAGRLLRQNRLLRLEEVRPIAPTAVNVHWQWTLPASQLPDLPSNYVSGLLLKYRAISTTSGSGDASVSQQFAVVKLPVPLSAHAQMHTVANLQYSTTYQFVLQPFYGNVIGMASNTYNITTPIAPASAIGDDVELIDIQIPDAGVDGICAPQAVAYQQVLVRVDAATKTAEENSKVSQKPVRALNVTWAAAANPTKSDNCGAVGGYFVLVRHYSPADSTNSTVNVDDNVIFNQTVPATDRHFLINIDRIIDSSIDSGENDDNSQSRIVIQVGTVLSPKSSQQSPTLPAAAPNFDANAFLSHKLFYPPFTPANGRRGNVSVNNTLDLVQQPWVLFIIGFLVVVLLFGFCFAGYCWRFRYASGGKGVGSLRAAASFKRKHFSRNTTDSNTSTRTDNPLTTWANGHQHHHPAGILGTPSTIIRGGPGKLAHDALWSSIGHNNIENNQQAAAAAAYAAGLSHQHPFLPYGPYGNNNSLVGSATMMPFVVPTSVACLYDQDASAMMMAAGGAPQDPSPYATSAVAMQQQQQFGRYYSNVTMPPPPPPPPMNTSAGFDQNNLLSYNQNNTHSSWGKSPAVGRRTPLMMQTTSTTASSVGGGQTRCSPQVPLQQHQHFMPNSIGGCFECAQHMMAAAAAGMVIPPTSQHSHYHHSQQQQMFNEQQQQLLTHAYAIMPNEQLHHHQLPQPPHSSSSRLTSSGTGSTNAGSSLRDSGGGITGHGCETVSVPSSSPAAPNMNRSSRSRRTSNSNGNANQSNNNHTNSSSMRRRGKQRRQQQQDVEEEFQQQQHQQMQLLQRQFSTGVNSGNNEPIYNDDDEDINAQLAPLLNLADLLPPPPASNNSASQNINNKTNSTSSEEEDNSDDDADENHENESRHANGNLATGNLQQLPTSNGANKRNGVSRRGSSPQESSRASSPCLSSEASFYVSNTQKHARQQRLPLLASASGLINNHQHFMREAGSRRSARQQTQQQNQAISSPLISGIAGSRSAQVQRKQQSLLSGKDGDTGENTKSSGRKTGKHSAVGYGNKQQNSGKKDKSKSGDQKNQQEGLPLRENGFESKLANARGQVDHNPLRSTSGKVRLHGALGEENVYNEIDQVDSGVICNDNDDEGGNNKVQTEKVTMGVVASVASRFNALAASGAGNFLSTPVTNLDSMPDR